ncbi:MAG: hypothetical protein WBR18_00840 [Anaerolineales bacterium]
MSACAPAPVQPTPTPSPLPPTITATFPFPTLAPTATEQGLATPTQPPGVLESAGDIVYQTDFSQAGKWPLGQDSAGAVSLFEEFLSVVLPRAFLTREIRSPAPARADFILDVQTQTEVCRGLDEYGVVFRQIDEVGSLRFTLTCQGGIRLRRTQGSSSRALVPFEDQVLAVNPGAPADNRITVRARGPDLDLYVNGALVLQASDPEPNSGFSGLIVISAADSTQTTVLFDDLTLYDWEP